MLDIIVDALPSSLINSNVSPRCKQQKMRNWGMFLGSHHFGSRGECWRCEIGTRKSDKQINYSHVPVQTKQQVG